MYFDDNPVLPPIVDTGKELSVEESEVAVEESKEEEKSKEEKRKKFQEEILAKLSAAWGWHLPSVCLL